MGRRDPRVPTDAELRRKAAELGVAVPPTYLDKVRAESKDLMLACLAGIEPAPPAPVRTKSTTPAEPQDDWYAQTFGPCAHGYIRPYCGQCALEESDQRNAKQRQERERKRAQRRAGQR